MNKKVLNRCLILAFFCVAAAWVTTPVLARQSPGAIANQADATERLLSRVPEGVTLVPDIAYREGHARWTLDLCLPDDFAKGPKRPAIVFVHGGGWRVGHKRNGIMINGAMRYAAKGFVCITVNYRLMQHAPFPASIQDVKTAVRWLRAHADEYNLDVDRIGGFGNSAGAHLVSMAGLTADQAELEGDGPWQEHSSRLTAVVAVASPMDLSHWVMPGMDDAVGIKETHDFSPVNHVNAQMPPFLLVHGTFDAIVPYAQSKTFASAAEQSGADDVELMTIKAVGHNVFNQARPKTHPAVEQFFERTLRGK